LGPFYVEFIVLVELNHSELAHPYPIPSQLEALSVVWEVVNSTSTMAT